MSREASLRSYPLERGTAFASRLARAAECVVHLTVEARVADARSIFALLPLCAFAGMIVELEMNGKDEHAVLTSITSVFYQGRLEEDSNHGDSAAGTIRAENPTAERLNRSCR
jgi:phosphotransferase system HPr (HPr) family protein